MQIAIKTTKRFNTHEAIKRLQKVGFKENQAEEIINTTKADLQQLKGELAGKATKADLYKLESNIIKWFVGTMIANVGIFAYIVKYL